MKIKNVNGINHIILENNEKIKISPNQLEGSIVIECDDDALNISGTSDVVGSIRGNGMLEKVYIPPVLSHEEIVEKCDEWLEIFKSVHDKFRELVLDENYKKQSVTMELTFYEYFSIDDSTKKGRKIDLDLVRYGKIIQEGVTISVDYVNDAVFKYLLANVVSYYVSVNYENAIIHDEDFSWNNVLYSGDNGKEMFCNLRGVYENSNYTQILSSILTNHNLNVSSAQTIENVKNQIHNQALTDCFDESIKYSSIQYDYIFPKTEKGAMLERK